MSKKLEAEFDTAMMSIYDRAKKEAGYNATAFLKMLYEHRGRETARRLIYAASPKTGYSALSERGRLDLTVEALIFDNPKWHPLFTPDELVRVKKRLVDYQYPNALKSPTEKVG